MARPRLVTDEQILKTMRASVLELGPSVSLDVVAERLGVTGPALLKRFGSRQKLMIEALRPPDRMPWVDANQPTDDAPLDAQLEQLFTGVWEFFAETVPCVMALRESGIDHEHWEKAVRPGPLRGLAAMVEWLERAQRLGLIAHKDIDTAANAMLGALHLRIISTHISRQSMAARHHRALLKSLSSFFADALAPQRQAPRFQKARA